MKPPRQCLKIFLVVHYAVYISASGYLRLHFSHYESSVRFRFCCRHPVPRYTLLISFLSSKIFIIERFIKVCHIAN
jgi:hypothetical protein